MRCCPCFIGCWFFCSWQKLAETLDTEVRRWSSGKEGNLRALLSTLQYVGVPMLKFWNNFAYASPLFPYPQLLYCSHYLKVQWISLQQMNFNQLVAWSWFLIFRTPSCPLFLFFPVWDLCRFLSWILVKGRLYTASFLIFLLCQILGPDSGWQPIHLTEVITSAAVKKAYRKATLCVHPDKLQQRGASIQHKYICEKVFDLLKVCLACRLSHIFLIYFNHVHMQFGCGTILTMCIIILNLPEIHKNILL